MSNALPEDRGVALVNMPWAALEFPSIQVGILASLVEEVRARPHVLNLNLHWMEHLFRASPAGAPVLSPADYELLSQAPRGLAEWVFSAPLAGEDMRGRTAAFRRLFLSCAGRPAGPPRDELARLYRLATRLRRAVPGFLAHWRDAIVALGPKVVCFTTTFRQTVPSLSLARMLKQAAPEISIVFGGSGCDGPMGAGLIRTFDWIDVVVRGEAEPVFGQLVTALLAGDRTVAPPGTCMRLADGTVQVEPMRAVMPSLESVPVPSFDRYFEDRARLSFASQLDVVALPVEGSRGCEWGQRRRCTFCSHLGSSAAYRVKPRRRMLEEMLYLAHRHRVLGFSLVDNVMSRECLEGVFPKLKRYGFDLYLSSRSDLTRAQVRLLKEAGVRCLQAGIESLDSRLLRLMKKGTDALHNIRLLKWAREDGLDVRWNLLCGIPGEDASDYRRMAELIPSLVHLDPPTLAPLDVRRFSAYFEDPGAFGIAIAGPDPSYRHLFGAKGAALDDLAFSFELERAGAAPDAAAVQELAGAVDAWRRERDQRSASLRLRRGRRSLEIEDRRAGAVAVHRLDELQAAIYTACDAGAALPAIERDLKRRLGEVPARGAIQACLDEFVRLRLAYEENSRYLSLALAPEPSA